MGMPAWVVASLAALLTVCVLLPAVRGHGRLIEPPSRASAWRYGFSTPPDYNDHESYCGGFTRQWRRNEGKCGVCGDPWDTSVPRAHEAGGAYGQGVVVRRYSVRAVVNIRVELTAFHQGYFEFRVCPDWRNATQECLDEHPLRLAKPQDAGDPDRIRYYPRDGNKIYEMKYRLPEVSCKHCLLQWRYVAGNNWGTCPDGNGAVGCGPQEEFRACADVTIAGAPGQTTPRTAGTSKPERTSSQPPAEHSPLYTPLPAIIVTSAALFAVVVLLALLYFYYYQVGKRVQLWIKGKKEGCPPVPPPRARRKSPETEDTLTEVSLA